MSASALCACVGRPGVFLTTQLNELCSVSNSCVRVRLSSTTVPPREVCCCALCARLCGVLKRVSSVGRMLWPATHVHARAARVPPQHGTLALSSVRGQRGVLVASQAGGATQVCGSARRAVLAGQRFVSARSCFVARPPRSNCRKLSGVLAVRLDASVWSPCRCPEESLPYVSRYRRVRHPTRL